MKKRGPDRVTPPGQEAEAGVVECTEALEKQTAAHKAAAKTRDTTSKRLSAAKGELEVRVASARS